MTDRSDEDLPEWARNMDPHELLAMLEAFVKIFRARHERQAMAGLERELQAAPSYSWPPAPSTTHLAFERDAAFVRRLMAEDRHTIILPKPQSLTFVPFDEAQPIMAPAVEHRALTVKRCAAPAPYVGDPYCITWSVAVDDANRWVASAPVTQPLTVH